MNEFLQSTPVIDCDEPAVVAAAAELARDASGDEQAARRCFLWVRDHVRHSSDCGIPVVTCSVSQVLRHRVGFCYAKSHLLAASLHARGILAALRHGRRLLDGAGGAYGLHGFVAVYLQRHGWHRIDPRGDKPGVHTDFCPPAERLAFTPSRLGETDIPGLYADALPCVVSARQKWRTEDEVANCLPNYAPID